MSDEELQAWHAHLSLHRQHVIMAAHIRNVSVGKTKAEKNEPKRDISEYE